MCRERTDWGEPLPDDFRSQWEFWLLFMANRVQKIKVKFSEENPADHTSWGLKAKELMASNWFTGPNFLWCGELPSGDKKSKFFKARKRLELKIGPPSCTD